MNPLLMLNFILAIGGLALTVVSVVLLADYLWRRGTCFRTLLVPYIWPLLILSTVGSVALSLIYSEYFGFVPCSLCWLQRIAIYPQALMALLAWWKKDTTYFPLYGIALSFFGLLMAIVQYIYQMLPHELREGFVPCLVDGSNADCALKVIDEFGFVTFPYLAAITFVFLITLYLYLYNSHQKQ